MPKQKLFDDDSEEEVSLKTENEYAKKYDQWRGKEEIHKLEQKYGSKALDSDASISSDSEDDSDEPPEVSEEVETQFLKTLALLKKKDPRIYDPGFKFFEEKEKETAKQTKEKTLTFADSDEDDDDENIFSIEKKAEIDDGNDSEQKQAKNIETTTGKEGKLKDFLTGKAARVDSAVEKDLEPLKALWSDPALDDREAFLRDYILGKKYLEDGDVGAARDRLRDDDDLEADEKTVEEQGKFERAYNFRFEEPDHEYLKRFPRTMSSIRPKDDSRARRRAELRTRKEEEKTRKMEEIGRLKALKLREIREKMARIKEVTGNDRLAFEEEDIEGDFDPEEHDRRMRAIFDDQYYGHKDDQKPVFPDLDDELEIENWDKYEPGQAPREAQDFSAEGPHCEDPDFNMDADFDPKSPRSNLVEEMRRSLGARRRNRKNKSLLAALLAADKPKYIPAAGDTYSRYMEEYYKMDCEDVIGGDLPTRFKYREVVPNDYGLTVEEILLADDKELTQWVPLKRIVRHQPRAAQQSEVHAYRQKAADASLKRKVLPSLFKDLPQEPELVVPTDNIKKKKKKKKNKHKDAEKALEGIDEPAAESKPNATENTEQNGDRDDVSITENKPKKKKDKRKHKNANDNEPYAVDDNNQVTTEDASVSEDKGNKKKKKHINTEESNPTENVTIRGDGNENVVNTPKLSKRQKKNKKKKGMVVENVQNAAPSESGHNIKGKKRKIQEDELQVSNKKNKTIELNKDGKNKDFKNNKFKNKDKNKQTKDISSDNPMNSLSDERLKAYGLNPKKYRSFLKYKKF